MTQKQVIIELDRQADRVSIKLKIPKEIEDYFKSISEADTAKSTKWFYDSELQNGAEFYKNADVYKEITDKLSNLGLYVYNDFGDGLVRNKQINIATLRVKGVSEGITLYSDNFTDTGIDFEFYIRELAVAIKAIWREYISKKTIKAVITYDI